MNELSEGELTKKDDGEVFYEAIPVYQMKRESVMARPDTNLTLACHNLSFRVPGTSKKAKEKSILTQVNGLFRAGRLTAVMGASGAGKTSLLNILAAVTSVSGKSRMEGIIRINGQTIAEHGIKMKNVSGYVHQDDVLLDTMTVREALQMSATLRLANVVDREERVNDLLGILGLENCQNTSIGSSMKKGISGGERKRTAIAMEMITNPAILFLDEPTSGLDTFTAFNVVSTLLQLAHDQGRTVVATVHQPSSETFHLFDDILLLAEGQVMYHGPVDYIVEYFASHSYQCPQYSNPADYVFMEVLNTQKQNAKETIEHMLKVWQESVLNKELLMELDEMPAGAIPATAVRQKASIFTQTAYLLKRSFRNVLRNKFVAQVKLFQSIFIGLLIGVIYLDVSSKPFQAQIQDRTGALFFIVLNQFMSSSMGVLSAFSQERPIFLREYTQGYYSLPPYYLTKVVVEFPILILGPVLMICICYFMIGFQSSFEKFVILTLAGVLTALCGTGLGVLSGAAFPNMGIGLAVLPMILLPLMLFSGLYVNAGSIPAWLAWIKYISPTFYGFNAAAKNEFTGLEIAQCPAPFPSPCSGTIALDQLSMNGSPTIAESFLVLAAIAIVLLTAGYIALWVLTRTKRTK
jgi:ATP-binding cassette subfamily G (WHITE) protein 1